MMPCNECGSYQRKWRRRFSIFSSALALLTSLFAVLTVFITSSAWLLHHDSKTSVSFAGVSTATDVIYIDVRNSGQTFSLLRNYRLTFGELPIEDVDLELANDGNGHPSTNVIPGNNVSRVELMLSGLRLKPNATFTLDDQQNLVKQVKIEIGVDESDGRVIRTDVFPLSSIRELVKKKL